MAHSTDLTDVNFDLLDKTKFPYWDYYELDEMLQHGVQLTQPNTGRFTVFG